MNLKLLSVDYAPEKTGLEKDFCVSFVLPVGSLSFDARGKLNEDQGCEICGKPTKRRCAQCQSASYCECQRTDWSNHKFACLPLKGGIWIKVKFGHSLPGLEGLALNVMQFNVFDRVNEISAKETLSSERPPPLNAHGDKVFLVKLQAGPGIPMYDRLRSIQGYIGKRGQESEYADLMEEMEGPRDGHEGLKMYRWAKRTGDWELSICLDRQPLRDIAW